MEPRYKVGDEVVVQNRFPPGHIRTPEFVRGKAGRIARYFGKFRNPEKLAYGKDGLPLCPLYWVEFMVNDVWANKPGKQQDKIVIEIYEHWLDPA
ncbi:MAG: nitrile hydratase subunit beta [Nitrospinaceae bacterium]|jgi:nitrile hydratase subunit beta|nr:nitrile hydratase subunit beta [Nitrospinaceae bacterium]MBT3432518.1 nitrile hydratase subunit beta [Nitrospinaceae bacterium]MBT3819879.1 nitrile hydratase subunit beta [Nitrospinaceae bacterium]MBT4095190.1 nitrile hydratase subunit beta [Nitrospinaceae bacterium]MBT4430000.1 nitrile hydratase subunit beta [Nitrospinaceae bacterium]